MGWEVLSLEEIVDELLSSDSVILGDHMSTPLEQDNGESLHSGILSSVLSVIWVWVLSVGWLVPGSPGLNGDESVLVSEETGPEKSSGGRDSGIGISRIDPDSVPLLDEAWVEVVRSGCASVVLPLVVVDAHIPGDVGINVEGLLDGLVVEEEVGTKSISAGWQSWDWLTIFSLLFGMQPSGLSVTSWELLPVAGSDQIVDVGGVLLAGVTQEGANFLESVDAGKGLELSLVIQAVLQVLLSQAGWVHSLVIESISLEWVNKLVLELTFERMSASVSNSDSLEVDLIIWVIGVELIKDGGEVGNINSGVGFSGDVEWVWQVLWV